MIGARISSAPPAVSSLGREAVELGASAGVILDDWQALVLEQAMGLRADGKWSAFEAAVNAARQNGKNEIALVRELAGMFLLGERLLIHSAHEFKTSTEHQRRIEEVIQDTPELHKRVKPKGYRHSHGEEGIELRSGQRLRFMTRTKGGGRGHTGDLVVFDEAMILAEAFLGALMPSVSARSVHGNPQLWYFGTAVDQLLHEHGLVLARLRERALAGGDPSLAYFEWSVDAADPDVVTTEMAVDEGLWALANPALGLRISAEHVRNEQRSMDARTFAVERLGVGDWPRLLAHESLIDLAAWDGLADPRSRPQDPVCFAFDVTPMRSWSSISVAGYRADGLQHLEVVEHREGTGWVAGRLAELQRKWRPVAVGFGKDSPAESLLPDLERERVRNIEPLPLADGAAACGRLFDAVEQRALRHMGDRSPHGGALRAALAGAAQKTYGDKWLWSRSKSSVDISPLVSASAALYLLSVYGKPRKTPLMAYV